MVVEGRYFIFVAVVGSGTMVFIKDAEDPDANPEAVLKAAKDGDAVKVMEIFRVTQQPTGPNTVRQVVMDSEDVEYSDGSKYFMGLRGATVINFDLNAPGAELVYKGQQSILELVKRKRGHLSLAASVPTGAAAEADVRAAAEAEARARRSGLIVT